MALSLSCVLGDGALDVPLAEPGYRSPAAGTSAAAFTCLKESAKS